LNNFKKFNCLPKNFQSLLEKFNHPTWETKVTKIFNHLNKRSKIWQLNFSGNARIFLGNDQILFNDGLMVTLDRTTKNIRINPQKIWSIGNCFKQIKKNSIANYGN